MPAERKDIAQRIVEHSQFEPMTGCLLWTGFVDKRGYAMTLGPIRNLVYVSRVLWEALSGKSLSIGECVLHHCDTPACINPKHLFIGTQRDNMLDCIRKGRSRLDRYARRQLSVEQVRDVRRLAALGVTRQRIGELFGLKSNTITYIVQGRTYSDVE